MFDESRIFTLVCDKKCESKSIIVINYGEKTIVKLSSFESIWSPHINMYELKGLELLVILEEKANPVCLAIGQIVQKEESVSYIKDGSNTFI